MINRKSHFELERMRKAGEIVARILSRVAQAAQPEVTTAELNRLAEEGCREFQVVPAFKGYQGFPASLCASVNEEVIHGIPGKRRLKAGDIIGLDFGVIYQGYYGDAALTVAVGQIAPEHERLLQVTKEALWKGIGQAREGNRLSQVSAAIQHYVESNGFSVVRDFVGHGIGHLMHEEPQIPNFISANNFDYDPILKSGMTLAIEPMVNLGHYQVKVDRNDHWTVTTKDRLFSAHFEHTVLVTKDAPEILTKAPETGDSEGLVSW